MQAALIQFLVPVFHQDGTRIAASEFESMRSELTKRFGGVTAFIQSPALGTWARQSDAKVEQDQMILVEVVVDNPDRCWWSNYRMRLEKAFRQDEIMMRMLEIERL